MAITPQEKAGVDPRCEFHYPPFAWRDLVPMLMFGTDEEVRQMTALCEERDRSLEDHLNNRPCCECLDEENEG
jgi:hypothetical protein